MNNSPQWLEEDQYRQCNRMQQGRDDQNTVSKTSCDGRVSDVFRRRKLVVNTKHAFSCFYLNTPDCFIPPAAKTTGWRLFPLNTTLSAVSLWWGQPGTKSALSVCFIPVWPLPPCVLSVTKIAMPNDQLRFVSTPRPQTTTNSQMRAADVVSSFLHFHPKTRSTF